MGDSFFTLFQAFIGAYLLYSGIKGTGQAFKADNIKEECKEKFQKFMRLFCLVMGPIALLSALFEYLHITIGIYITYALFGVGVIYALVVTMKMTNRPPKKEKKTKKK